ncbi:MAG: MFS transporter [Gammaproteobacteria bacterium]|nr:MAG: MFS transporter [Gammaproteobacteria bacterium]
MNQFPFRAYLAARVLISLADTMLTVSIGWHLYQFSGNPFDLALVGLMQILPMLGLFIVTGWVVDHYPRNLILIVCAILEAIAYLGLAFSMQDGELSRVVVFSLLFLHGCARSFNSPALQAILPNIVTREFLPHAVAISSAAWTTASTVGPFVAGLMIGWVDFHTYWLLAVLSSLGAVCYFLLPKLPSGKPLGRGWRPLLDGIHYVLASPIVLPSIALDLFIVFFGSVVALLPVYAVDVLKVGPEALGMLRAMPALGGVMMGLLFSRLPPLRHTGNVLFLSLLIFSVSILVFAFSASFWLSLAALWVYGAADMVSVNIRATLVQFGTPDELRGRVSAVNVLFIATSNELGDFRAGSVAALIGPVATVVTGAIMAFGVTFGGYALCTRLRHLDRMDQVAVTGH